MWYATSHTTGVVGRAVMCGGGEGGGEGREGGGGGKEGGGGGGGGGGGEGVEGGGEGGGKRGGGEVREGEGRGEGLGGGGRGRGERGGGRKRERGRERERERGGEREGGKKGHSFSDTRDHLSNFCQQPYLSTLLSISPHCFVSTKYTKYQLDVLGVAHCCCLSFCLMIISFILYYMIPIIV